MDQHAVNALDQPRIAVDQNGGGSATVTLTGLWTLRGVAQNAHRLLEELRKPAADPEARWVLDKVTGLDSVGAFMLWTATGGKCPANLAMRPEHSPLFRRWANRVVPAAPPAMPARRDPIDVVANSIRRYLIHLAGFVSLIGQFVIDVGTLFRRPTAVPWRDISATIYQSGVKALGITALLGFLVGIVVTYLSSLELKSFGAGSFIVVIAGVGTLRELGPMLTAVLVAGRSGSAMTAQLGVMRVTEELDALAAMGISHSLRLVLPKILALVVVMPLLVVWSDILAMLGSMLAARATLGFGFGQFLITFPQVVPLSNFWLGVGKGSVFGALVALVACHFGMQIKPNTDSLSRDTTNSVVAAITLAIMADAVFAVVFKDVGLP